MTVHTRQTGAIRITSQSIPSEAPSDEDAVNDAARVRTDLFRVRHVTRYLYNKPVRFDQHRGMFRPHDAPDLRLLSIRFDIKPQCAMRWVHDVFSNAVTVLDFEEPSDVMEVACTFEVIRTAFEEPNFPIDVEARRYPFVYRADQQPDLAPCIAAHYPDQDGAVEAFARRFTVSGGTDTWTILDGMNRAIHDELAYNRREEPGVRAPDETLRRGEGSCRDYAVLMCEAVRRLGFAARFVTGYLYDPALDPGAAGDGGAQTRGAGSTHAWVQVFLPGAGWIEFDPTNGGVATGSLIKTGVARTPAQAVPLAGTYQGAPQDAAGLEVSVDVSTLAPTLRG